MAQIEIPPELELLSSNQPELVEEAKNRFHEYFNSTKESWLLNGLVDYFLASGCQRCVDILVGVREPHDLHFFNKMAESLRNTSSTSRLSVLNLLSHVVMRQPTWLYKITQHGIFKELLKILKTENDIVNLVSALLTLVILLPMIPAYVGQTLNEIFEIFSRLAAWNTSNPDKLQSDQLVHLQISLHFLFYRLYGMYPCNFLSYLRQQYGARENLNVFRHTIKPMLDTVKMHPMLVTTSKESETTTSRWKTMEHHDVVVECAKLSIEARPDNCPTSVATFRARSESELRRLMEASGYQDLKSVSGPFGEVKDLWGGSVPVTPQPTAETSIRLTPVTQSQINSSFVEIGTSPPEAAVEATPETTPVKDPRVYSSGRALQQSNPSVVRALNTLGTSRWNPSSTPNNSQPSSPMKKDQSPFRFPEKEFYGEVVQRKIQNIIQERNLVSAERRMGNAVVNGGGAEHNGSQEEQEDQEVLEISQQGELTMNMSMARQCDSVLQDYHPPHGEDIEPCEQESGSPCNSGGLHMPNSTSLYNVRNRLRYYSQCGADPTFPPTILVGSEPFSHNLINPTLVRRAHSCPEIKKERPSFNAPGSSEALDETLEQETVSGTREAETQTQEPVETPLYPYDHMLLALFPLPSVPPVAPSGRSSPSLLLDEYLQLATTQENLTSIKRNTTELEKTARDQLMLMHLQLKFERHRRDSHAERNRRLLGKARNHRWQEEHNAALRDQLALLQTEINYLHTEINKMKEERRRSERNLNEDIESWRDQCVNFEKQNRELKSDNQRLYLELQQSKLQHTSTAKKLQQVEAMYFSVGRELREARAQASAGEAMRSQVEYLQKELVLMGEELNRTRSQCGRLAMRSGKSKQLFYESYQEQIRTLSGQLESKSTVCEALKSRIAELETALSRKDMHISEQKRCLKAAKEECQEEREAVETKYKSEVATNRKLECHVLELTSKLECGRRTRRNISAAQDALSLAERGGINSPLSLSLSSSEGLSLSSTLTTTDAAPKDLQAVLDAPESSAIPEIPEFDDLPGPSGLHDEF